MRRFSEGAQRSGVGEVALPVVVMKERFLWLAVLCPGIPVASGLAVWVLGWPRRAGVAKGFCDQWMWARSGYQRQAEMASGLDDGPPEAWQWGLHCW